MGQKHAREILGVSEINGKRKTKEGLEGFLKEAENVIVSQTQT